MSAIDERRAKTLSKKVALVTGASSGIGRATALELARRGSSVIITSRNEKKLQDVAESMQLYPSETKLISCDLAEQEDVMNLTEKALSWKGKIDFLINIAGVGFLKPLVELSIRDFESVFSVNVRSVFLLIQALLPHMIERGEGSIVNIGSGAAKFPAPGLSVYGASKAALKMMTDALRLEVRDRGIRVILVNPGPVDTNFFADTDLDQLDKSYFLDPKEIAVPVCNALEQDKNTTIAEMDIRPTSPKGTIFQK